MQVLPANILNTPSIADKTECLVTNGTGSFASLAINGGLCRKFHGLLVHSKIPPMDRLMTWHYCAESVNGQSLDARQSGKKNQLKRTLGERFLIKFFAKPIPTWYYQVGGHCLKKELFMVQGQASTILKYTLVSSVDEAIDLKLTNSVCFRGAEQHYDQLTQETLNQWHIHAAEQTISAHGINLKLGCQNSNPENKISTTWQTPTTEHIKQPLYYAIEQEDQGYDEWDCSLEVQQTQIKLSVGDSCYMIGTLNDSWPNAAQQYQKAIQHSKQIYHEQDFANDLAHSALQLLADRESVQGKTILAGFPWFGDWGRDTMIALPGTTLATQKYDSARAILSTFAHYLNAGMLPNKFPDRSGEPLKYNTIDATLWFFWAIQQYVHYSNDWQFVQQELYEDLKGIIQHHLKGTRYGIRVDEDGLIQGGDAQTQLTWMDVKFDDQAVTPRYGKAVEINALWYNALCFTEQCRQQFNDSQAPYTPLIDQVKNSFQELFWHREENYCYDYVAGEFKNSDVRCNQIFAVSLPFSPLELEQQRAVFDRVYKELYTPVGLRSLSSKHPDYHSQYYGALRQRDLAYHQGTVWAWPMGGFIDAAMKLTNNKKFAAGLLTGLKQHFYSEAGIHGISEVFDGDAPHAARGCFNQAWSVAEVLRVVDRYELDVP